MTSQPNELDIDLQSNEHIAISPPDPRLIQELFDKDPLGLSDQDIDQIILAFRLDRVSYLQASAEPKTKKSSSGKALAKKESSAPTVEISKDLLSDLGLDL